MSSDTRWKVYIDELESTIRIGLHDHEKTPQRILVSASIEGIYPSPPQSIDDCFNYDHFYDLIVVQWPKEEHVALLETLVLNVLKHIFKSDARVDKARVCISKPDIFKEAKSVGVEAEWTRQDYEYFQAEV